MMVRKSLPLALACGLLLAASQPAKATSIDQLAGRGALLAAATFGTNFLACYAIQKLWNWGCGKHSTLRAALGSTVLTTGIVANIYLVRAALNHDFWHTPTIFNVSGLVGKS